MAYKLVVNFLILVVVAGCAARPPALIGIDNPKTPVASISGNSIHRIFFATNRALSNDPAELFSGERGGTLAFGSVDVSMPPNHETGKIDIGKIDTTLQAAFECGFSLLLPPSFGGGSAVLAEV